MTYSKKCLLLQRRNTHVATRYRRRVTPLFTKLMRVSFRVVRSKNVFSNFEKIGYKLILKTEFSIVHTSTPDIDDIERSDARE